MLKNKIHQSKFEDLIGFIRQFMNRGSISSHRRVPRGAVHAEGFYGKEGGARKLLGKEKKGLFWARASSFSGEGDWHGFYHADHHFFLWGVERAHVTDYLTGA